MPERSNQGKDRVAWLTEACSRLCGLRTCYGLTFAGLDLWVWQIYLGILCVSSRLVSQIKTST